jgi:mitochondrial fission protein ELM1
MSDTQQVRPLAGRSAWLITDGKMGMDVQVNGVAAALGLRAIMKRVTPTGAQKFLAPFGPVAKREGIGAASGPFALPWPEVVIATGRQSIPYLRAIRARAGFATYSIVLQDPKTGVGTADLIWVPAHDKLRGTNVITTPTAPHPFTPERIAALRAQMPTEIAALPGPRVAVVLGGKNGVYKFTDACDDRLEASLRSFAALGVSFLITSSRRTHERLLRKVDAATAGAPRLLWAGEGPNPYPDFLAHADALIVTADSVNMCGEAAATGKPVFIFTPSGGSAKFGRFHQALAASGAARPLPLVMDRWTEWTYRPLQAAEQIAREVERRWAQRRTFVSGDRSA